MPNRSASSARTSLTFDDHGEGPVVILVPGAGDVATENRFLVPALQEAGYRTVTVDLPGHGESPLSASYGVAETAAALVDLVDSLGAGPAVVIANSFGPAAAVWAAVNHPDQIIAVIAISPHFSVDTTIKGRTMTLATRLLMRGDWAAPVWERLYRSWYKGVVPDDLDDEVAKLRQMLSDPGRRRAVRETLTAHRRGVDEKMKQFSAPAMVVFGADDDHFADPTAEASEVAERLGAEVLMVDGAGHYPHVERSDLVAPAIVSFLGRLPQ